MPMLFQSCFAPEGCSGTVVVVACAEIIGTLAMGIPVTLSADVVLTMAVGVPVTLLWWSVVVVSSNISTISATGVTVAVSTLYPGAKGEGVVAGLDGLDVDDVFNDRFVETFDV